MTTTSVALALALTLPVAQPEPATPDVTACVQKGLKWLAGQQKADGGWAGINGVSRTPFTAAAGLALLMEGSTPDHGPYAPHLRKAIEWMEKNAQETGQIGGKNTFERTPTMSDHALALLFLASAYDVDDDGGRRARIGKVLDKAVDFAGERQSRRGGWNLAASANSPNDDSQSTAAVLHALQAASRAGLRVPKTVTDKAVRSLAGSTTRDGGVVRFVPDGAAPPAGAGTQYLTAGAGAAVLMYDGRRPDEFTRWLRTLRPSVNLPRLMGNNSTPIFTQFQLARVAFALGDNGHRRLDPDISDAELLRWSTYRITAFRAFKDAQSADGSWSEPTLGPAYITALSLIILQLENDYLPAFSR